MRRRKYALISTALLSPAYRVLTIGELETSVSVQRPRRAAVTLCDFKGIFGAGEGIRTPDPNLGKGRRKG